MAEEGNDTPNLRESYQPLSKTYSPKIVNQARDSYNPILVGNYQPVISLDICDKPPAPPTSGSGVPPARTNGSETISNSTSKGSQE